MFRLIGSLFFNIFAHYTLSNRLEYIKLRVRRGNPPQINQPLGEPIHISRTFVLSLSGSINRQSKIENRFSKEKVDYTIAEGVLGMESSRTSYAISDRSLSYLTYGSIGCWLGHYSIWGNVHREGAEHSMVFEDDVILAQDFKHRLDSVLQFTPKDFDIIFLNSGNNYPHNKRVVINDSIFIPYQIRNGAYGYIISLSGVNKLLKMIPSVKVTRGGIDSAIGALIRNKKILAYHLNEPICWVDYSFPSSTKLK
jgi:GR25 family glycosyltransferase involved in LPS biosynthesis